MYYMVSYIMTSVDGRSYPQRLVTRIPVTMTRRLAQRLIALFESGHPDIAAGCTYPNEYVVELPSGDVQATNIAWRHVKEEHGEVLWMHMFNVHYDQDTIEILGGAV